MSVSSKLEKSCHLREGEVRTRLNEACTEKDETLDLLTLTLVGSRNVQSRSIDSHLEHFCAAEADSSNRHLTFRFLQASHAFDATTRRRWLWEDIVQAQGSQQKASPLPMLPILALLDGPPFSSSLNARCCNKHCGSEIGRSS